MKREIVVFERDENNTDSGQPELDFRLVRCAMPSGSCPLAIVTADNFTVECGQWFDEAEVKTFAEEQSGYKSK